MESRLTVIDADVLCLAVTLTLMIEGLTVLLEELAPATFMFWMGFPTSLLLQDDKNGVTLTLIGGSKTSNRGSWSKHRYSFLVVKLWTMGYRDVSSKLRVSGGGTTF